jgi:cytochrome P450
MDHPTITGTGRCPFRASEWDPTAPETFGSAQATYAALRRENPLPWSNDYGGFWAAMSYDDVVTITRDPETFSTTTQNVVPHVPRSSRRPPLHFDPPEHDIYRRVIDPTLRRAAVRGLEERFRAAAQQILAPMLEQGWGDYSKDFAMPFVAQCFAEYLGVPYETAVRVREIGVRYSFAIQDMDKDTIMAASDELYAIAESIYTRQDGASDEEPLDLVSGLRRAAEDPENAITHTSAVATIRQMIVAGMGAPQAVLGSAVVHLAQNPQLQQRLRQDPGLLPAAVEELLRLYAPYRVFARTATRDVELGGRRIRKGEPIALIFPSANRDEQHFDDVDTFDLDRKPNRHLAFGRGPHRCPAAAMGRSELVIALEVLLTSTSSFGLAGEVEMMNWLEFGPRSVPLRLEAAPAASVQEKMAG